MISVLFVDRNSIYKTLGVDSWDVDRDACRYAGSWPVVAHPPCRTWSRMRKFSKAPACEKLTAFVALAIVRECGGVLEHPCNSSFWPAASLPLPGKTDAWGGYTICVDQFWWGHRAAKKTFLYIVGCSQHDLPPIPLRFDCIQHVVSISRNKRKKEITRRERSATPPDFARWLISVAEKCLLIN